MADEETNLLYSIGDRSSRGKAMNRRELFVSFLSPSNRHFLHQKCLGPVIPDTLDSSFVRASFDHLVGTGG